MPDPIVACCLKKGGRIALHCGRDGKVFTQSRDWTSAPGGFHRTVAPTFTKWMRTAMRAARPALSAPIWAWMYVK
jgi:hypothetical protein